MNSKIRSGEDQVKRKIINVVLSFMLVGNIIGNVPYQSILAETQNTETAVPQETTTVETPGVANEATSTPTVESETATPDTTEDAAQNTGLVVPSSNEAVKVKTPRTILNINIGSVPATFDDVSGVLTFSGGAFNLTNWTNVIQNAGVDLTKVTKIVFSQPVGAGPSLQFAFQNMPNLVSVEGLSNLDTSNVTSMRYMFSMDPKLESLDLSGFNTSNVRSMFAMFQSCEKLPTINVSSFNTSKVTDFGFMFSGCDSLQSLNVSNFDTSSATTMRQMFAGTEALRTLDLSNFNTTNVTDMNSMFAFAGATSINVSSFNTSKVKDMYMMFSSNYHLSALNISNFDTSSVTQMNEMFWRVPLLQELTLGTNFRFHSTYPSTEGKGLDASTTPPYIGKWQFVGTGTPAAPEGDILTKTQLWAYDGTQPGTYVWAKNLAPVLTVPAITEVQVGEAFDPKTGVTVRDDFDTLTINHVTINPTTVSTAAEGVFVVNYRVTDSDGLTTTAKQIVVVNNGNIKVGTNYIIWAKDFEKRVAQVVVTDDQVKVDAEMKVYSRATGADVTATEAVTVNLGGYTNTVGVYPVVFTVTADAQATIEVDANVINGEAPELTVPAITEVQVGGVFDPKTGVTVSDDIDTLTIDDVTINPATVSTADEGVFVVEYSVTDSDDYTTTAKQVVVVNNGNIKVGANYIILAEGFEKHVSEVDTAEAQVKTHAKLRIFNKATGEEITLTEPVTVEIGTYAATVGTHAITFTVVADAQATITIDALVHDREVPVPTVTPTVAPTVAPTAKPTVDPGRTCQDDGYPAGYYWNGTACVIDKTVVPTATPTVKPTAKPVTPSASPKPEATASATPTASSTAKSEMETAKPSASPSASPVVAANDANNDQGGWALVNVMLTVLIALLGIVGFAIKSKKEEVDGDEVHTFERNGVMKIVGGVLVIAAVIFMFVTQNFSLPMQFVDNWTFITVIIAIASAIVFFFSTRWIESEE